MLTVATLHWVRLHCEDIEPPNEKRPLNFFNGQTNSPRLIMVIFLSHPHTPSTIYRMVGVYTDKNQSEPLRHCDYDFMPYS